MKSDLQRINGVDAFIDVFQNQNPQPMFTLRLTIAAPVNPSLITVEAYSSENKTIPLKFATSGSGEPAISGAFYTFNLKQGSVLGRIVVTWKGKSEAFHFHKDN